ncbi:(2Fe-2S)-binding protein [Geomicrobium sediminis]|nr:(2Fe-2S)-binding protein [Geomicrobium sediminis]
MISMTLNGERVSIQANETDRLTDVLRHGEPSLTGTKLSCGIGRCGACSVLVNGELVNSCLLMAYQVEGASVTTIEGVGKGSLDPIQIAFMEEGGFQCGYCTPGMVMAVKALLLENPEPNDEQIVEGLSGNICRCTGYEGIKRAVRAAIRKQN